MLKLQNIHVQLARPAFTATSEKYLRVSVGNVARKTTNPAKVNNEKSIEWAESLTLPLLYNRDFSFEIFDKHEFGYNPEQFKTMLVGTLSVVDLSQKHSTWEIYTSGNEKIGFLSASIVSKTTALSRKESLIRQKNQSKLSASSGEIVNNSNIPSHSPLAPPQQRKVLRVVSIVARIPNSNLRKGFIEIQVGQDPSKIIKTKAIKSRAGQLVFVDAKQLLLGANDTAAQIRVHTISSISKQENIVGQGTLELIGPKPSKRVVLIKQGLEAGEVYIDSRILDESKASKIDASHSRIFNESTQIAEEGRAKSITPSKSIDFTRLEHFGIQHTSRVMKPVLGDLHTSMISTLSTNRYKKSVVNQNNNIIFPREKRFMLYQDKQNQRVSYLQDRSFEFKSPGSKNNYQGKFIGYGGKTDFTRGRGSQSPGVGNYRLPSIWDRY